jgi:CubicO group peptidase (beta-lactamase class C family)
MRDAGGGMKDEPFMTCGERFIRVRFAESPRGRENPRTMKALRFVFVLLLAAPLAAATPQPSLASRVDRFIAPFVARNAFSGVVLVARGDETLLQKAYGMANVEFGVPVRVDTRFAIASITKVFTRVILVRLFEEGKLAPSDPLAKWVPDFPSADRITIDHLSNHRSGVRDPMELRGTTRANLTTAEVVQLLAKKPLASEPGAVSSYTTANYTILAHIIERVTGKPYSDVVREYVYTPAGMRDSGELISTTVVPRLAGGYMPDPFTGALSVCGMEDTSWKAGGGSSYSTAADLRKFARAYFAGKLMKTPTSDTFGESTLYDKKVLRASGSFPGASAQLLHFLDDDTTIVVLANNYANVPGTITGAIAGMLYDRPFLPSAVDVATDQSTPIDPRILGRYSLEGIPFPFTIDLRRGVPVLSFNPRRMSRLLRLADGSWFSPLEWATLRFSCDETACRSASWTSGGSERPLAVTRLE